MAIVGKTRWCLIFVALLASLLAPSPALGSTYGNGYQYRRAIVLSHAKISNTDQANFPVLISGVYPYLATVANGGLVQNANGYDIVFSLDPEGATILDHEIETYDPVTGTVNFWVMIPTLSHTVDTVIYLFYGNSSVTVSQENKVAVWQNGYVSVYHLPNGSALSVTDSLNANNGTNQGATAVAGLIDGAAGFNGSTSYIALPAAAFGNYPTSGSTTSYSLSYEAWFKTTSSGVILGQTDGTAPGGSPSGWVPAIYVDTAGHIRASVFYHGSTSAQLVSTKTYNDNQWHFVVDTYTNGSEALYVDGQILSTQSVSQNSYSSKYGYFLGTGETANWGSGSGAWFYLNGALDEVRISGGARSADWIATEYASQSSPSTFYSVESQSTPSSPPTIQFLSPAAGIVGNLITVQGFSFQDSQSTSKVTFNGVTATPTSWNDASIKVPVPVGTTTGNVIVTVGSVTSNGVQFTLLPTPSITNLSLTTGAVGASVTITGTNFGSTQGSNTVTFNGTTASNVANWTGTQIVVSVPTGATTGPVVVTASGIPSNGVTFTVVPAPQITSVSPTTGAAGASVTIKGVNFGGTQGSGAVTFYGTAGSTISSWSASQIVASVPAGAETGPIMVNASGVASNGVTFTVLPTPSVASLSPSSGGVGTPVTIAGANFGEAQGSSKVTFNGTAGVAQSWAASQIVVPVPAAATTGPVIVTVGGVGSNAVTFTVNSAPSITSLSPSLGPVGTTVTINGNNFGTSQGSSSVTFNGITATPSTWTNTSIKAPVPSGASTGPVVVTVGGLASNAPTFTVSSVPTITNVSPNIGPVGTSVTVTGENFGASKGSSTVTFNGTTATPTTWGNASIKVPVPAGAATGAVVVTVGGVSSNGVLFTVGSAPSITSLSPSSGSIGSPVTIGGGNFGSVQGSSRVTFNGVVATASSWASNSISVLVPTGATTGNVVVKVAGVASNPSPFTVTTTPPVPPALTSLFPTSGLAGTQVEISGGNFGATQGSSAVSFNGVQATPTFWATGYIVTTVPNGATTGNVVVTVGGSASNGLNFIVGPTPTITQQYYSGAAGTSTTIRGTNFGATQGTSTLTFNGTAVTTTNWSTNQITFTVPAGAVTGTANLVVTVSGMVSNTAVFNVVPGILNISPDLASVGTQVTINGSNFGSTQGSSLIYFPTATGTVTATPISWSNTAIVVAVPSGAVSGNVYGYISNQYQLNYVWFTVGSAPVLTGLSSTSGPVGTPVTISGSNFGSRSNAGTVTFNGTPVTYFLSWSPTSIVAPVPQGATTGNVLVSVGGVASNGLNFSVTAGPGITSLSPTNGGIGTTVYVEGNGFGATQGTSTLTFNGMAAPSSSLSWSDTYIYGPVPTGATTGNVIVNVGGVASNGISFTVQPAPTIQSVSPPSGYVGESIQISGYSFGATQSSSTVTFNGTPATPTAWSPTLITVPVPVGATTGNVVVTVAGTASTGVSFTVTPGITSLSPMVGQIGTSVTVKGSNFGSTQGTSAIYFGSVAGLPTQWTASQIIVPVPSGVSSGGVSIHVVVGGVNSNYSIFTVGSAPNLSMLSPTSGPVGSPVTITGTNLSQYGSPIVTFNGVQAQVLQSGNTMIVMVPSGATTGPVIDTVNSVPSNSLAFTVTSGPGIASLSRSTGSVGATIDITGGNFGSSQGSGTVTFNGKPATASYWSSGTLVVTVPSGATTGNVVVTVGGIASNALPFTVVPAAVITSLSPAKAGGQPSGSTLTVTGTNFGTTAGLLYFGATQLPITSWTNTSISTTVYAGAGQVTAPVSVQAVGTYVQSNGVLFTILGDPYVNSITPSSGTVGTSATLTANSGYDFGATQSSSTITFNGAPAVPTAWSSTSITVPVPAGASNGCVVLTVNGVQNSCYTSVYFAVLPSLSSLSTTSGPVETQVTINGTGFGPSIVDNNDPFCNTNTGSVTFNGALAHPISWSPTAITVDVPDTATTGPVVVSTCNSSSKGLTFTVTSSGGIIAGKIANALSKQPVSGVTVAALQSGVTIASTTSTLNGSYSISNLATGTYDLQVSGPGYVTALKTGNSITSGATATINLALSTAPILSSVSPAFGGVGTSVTIVGSNFGSNQADSSGSVTFNGVTATTTNWSANSIVVPVPSGATTGPLVVSVGGVASNATTFNINGGSLTGTVTNAANGQAVSGAAIQALASHIPQGNTTSASNGSYTISNLPSGTYDVVVSAAGLGSVVVTGQVVTVGSPTTVNVALPAAGTDSGTVTNGTSGISGATVSALQNGDAVSTATTNSSGAFTMANLAAGTYSVQASAPGYATQTTAGIGITAGKTTTTNFSLAGQPVITYDYDALGRLVGVVDSLTGSAVYNYDAVGNVTSIQRLSSAQVVIISFSPAAGLVGTSVTINGNNFSTTASQNTVTFNGTAATVVTASSTQLVVKVPSGATSGPISVTTPAGSASSATAFTVQAAGTTTAPTITGISPPVSGIGDTVTITGTNFDPNPANDAATLNGSRGIAVAAATATSLSVVIPSGATTGRISVTTTAGSVTSANYLFVAPAPYSTSTVGYTGQITSLPGSQTMSIGTNQIGILAFDGIADQAVTLLTSSSSFPNGCTVPGVLVSPIGTDLFSPSGCFGGNNNVVGSTPLPETGTYVVLLGPDTGGAGGVNVAVGNVQPTVTGYLWLDGSIGPTVPVNIQTWGQQALFMFNGSAQQSATVHVTQNTIPGMNVNVFSPDGTQIATTQTGSPSFTLSLGTLPMTGSYLVQIVPNNGTQYIGNLKLSVTSP